MSLSHFVLSPTYNVQGWNVTMESDDCPADVRMTAASTASLSGFIVTTIYNDVFKLIPRQG